MLLSASYFSSAVMSQLENIDVSEPAPNKLLSSMSLPSLLSPLFSCSHSFTSLPQEIPAVGDLFFDRALLLLVGTLGAAQRLALLQSKRRVIVT